MTTPSMTAPNYDSTKNYDIIGTLGVEMYICRDIIGTLGSYHTQKVWQQSQAQLPEIAVKLWQYIWQFQNIYDSSSYTIAM